MALITISLRWNLPVELNTLSLICWRTEIFLGYIVHTYCKQVALKMIFCRFLIVRLRNLLDVQVFHPQVALHATIRPRVQYDSTVWWSSSVRIATAQRLANFQYLACLDITGPIRTTWRPQPQHGCIEVVWLRYLDKEWKNSWVNSGITIGYVKIAQLTKKNTFLHL